MDKESAMYPGFGEPEGLRPHALGSWWWDPEGEEEHTDPQLLAVLGHSEEAS